MDMHVKLGACGVHAMKELVERYVGVTDHELLGLAEGLVAAGAATTPADVGELLLRNRGDPEGDPEAAVTELVAELKMRVGCVRDSEEELDESETTPAESWEMLPEKKGRTEKAKLLRRLSSPTKSETGQRGV